MESHDPSRRSLLHTLAAVIAAATTPFGWAEIAQAMQHAHVAAQTGTNGTITFLSSLEAADIEAVAAQIVPSDDSPGAREAGVVYFIDRALATFLSQLAPDYRSQLAGFQSAYRERYPTAGSFASLTSQQQIEHLKRTDQTPFFATTHLLTMLGMFTLPTYGGNRNNVGWKLIGFEDAHVFYPPFGYYDRDYPGFIGEPERSRVGANERASEPTRAEWGLRGPASERVGESEALGVMKIE